MKIVLKNKIAFVCDMLWLRHNDLHQVNIYNFKKHSEFNYYCKNNKLAHSFGFITVEKKAKLNINLDNQKSKTKKKVKKIIPTMVSLGVFISNALDLSEATDDMIICFKINEDEYAYVFIYQGAIFTNDGEYISDEGTLKAKITLLCKEYTIKNLRIFDDVPFYNDKQFLENNNFINVNVINSVTENNKIIPASDYYLWQNKNFKKYLKSSIIRPIAFLQKEHIRILYLLLVLTLFASILYLKKEYFPDNIQETTQDYIYQNTVGVDAKLFLESCFKDNNRYLVNVPNWQIKTFNCNLTGMQLIYENQNSLGSKDELLKKIKWSNINVSSDNQTATIINNFILNKEKPIVNKTELMTDQLKFIQDKVKKYDLTVVQRSGASIEIQTTISPNRLYEENIISKLNILSISMTVDSSGFYVWNIKGDLNGK